MALNIAQHSAAWFSASSGSSFVALPANCGIGSSILLAISPPQLAINTVTAITSAMGTFSRINAVAGITAGELEWWACPNTGAADNHFTPTFAGGGFAQCFAFEITGQISTIVAGGTGSVNGGTDLVVNNTAAVKAFCAVAGYGQNSTPPAGNWTNIPAGTTGQWQVAYQIVTVANPTADWAFGGSGYISQGAGIVQNTWPPNNMFRVL